MGETTPLRPGLLLRLIPTALAVLLGGATATAQLTPAQGRPAGTVSVAVRTGDGRPLPDRTSAELAIAGESPLRGSTVSGPGVFAFSDVEWGPLTVTVEAPGYLPVTRFVDHRGTTRIAVALSPQMTGLQEPDIRGSRLLAAREWVIPTTAATATRRRIAEAAGRPPGEAISTLQQERAADPDFYATYNNLGVSYLRQGLAGPALKSLQKAVELAPRSVVARRNLGLALLAAGRFEESAAELEASTALSASFRGALGLGEAYYRLGRFEDAAARFQEAAGLGTAPAWVCLRLGQALLRSGDQEAAVTWLKRYAASSGTGADSVRRWLAQLGIAPR